MFKGKITSHPCPYCGSHNSKARSWSHSGGIIGAAMLHEFKCKDCKNEFNGKTGKPITSKDRMIVIGKILVGCSAPFLVLWLLSIIIDFFL